MTSKEVNDMKIGRFFFTKESEWMRNVRRDDSDGSWCRYEDVEPLLERIKVLEKQKQVLENMQLIKGDTPMATELYEELTREEVETILVLHNHLDDMLKEIGGCFDITLSTMRILQNSMWKLRDTFKFKPQVDDKGNRPADWKPYVLKDDPRAWYNKGET